MPGGGLTLIHSSPTALEKAVWKPACRKRWNLPKFTCAPRSALGVKVLNTAEATLCNHHHLSMGAGSLPVDGGMGNRQLQFQEWTGCLGASGVIMSCASSYYSSCRQLLEGFHKQVALQEMGHLNEGWILYRGLHFLLRKYHFYTQKKWYVSFLWWSLERWGDELARWWEWKTRTCERSSSTRS